MSELPSFELPALVENKNGWGPVSSSTSLQFQDVPYVPFSKADKISRMSDWTQMAEGKNETIRQRGRNARDQHQTYGSSAASAFTYQRADESAFSVVTKSTPTSKKPASVFNNRGQFTRNRGMQRLGSAPQGRGGSSFGQRKRQHWTGNRFHRQRYASVQVGNDWELKQEIEFSRLSGLNYVISGVTEAGVHGNIGGYDKKFDRIPARQPIQLRKQDCVAYNVSASDDPVLQKLADENKAKVFASDVVLATLMIASRTVNPWDIVINRVDDKLFLDKRDGGPLDYLTVNENAVDPPIEGPDKDANPNSPSMLAQEANEVNRHFLSMISSNASAAVTSENPNPFRSEDDGDNSPNANARTVAAYKYRIFDITARGSSGDDGDEGASGAQGDEDTCLLAVRTELNAVDKTTNQNYLFARALNQFSVRAPGAGGALDWNTKIHTSRGAVVATERKNNAAKLAKWGIQAVLANANQLKLGYVSRINPAKRSAHQVLTVEKYRPEEFLKQLNVDIDNAWGIVKAVVDLCLALPEGRYVLVRDPNKPKMFLYLVPPGTFDDDDESELATATPL
ncbi:hypothetical protein H4219_004629 [Mycoemilia scoparia]|uniref:Eukaryotic translation initiation factor 3 subunit D n=1 Tax=Mycoemilia scoparia TaxID=417184 RepID=A0A9W7ZWU3_9FUNG|nr:hypothetical protein H4219_004629 [Mycoemilia scoparia]